MELDLITITAPKQTSSDKNDADGKRVREENFTNFFEKMRGKEFLNKNSNTETIDLKQYLESETLNSQLDQEIASLQKLFLSSEEGSAEIYDLGDIIGDIQNLITTSSNPATQKVSLEDAAKLFIISKLNGTPVPQVETQPNLTASVFSNTEATLDGNALFEKILSNLNQEQGISLSLESIIASGLNPAEFEHLSSADAHVILQDAAIQQEFGEDLIALLGLSQNLPVQTILTGTQRTQQALTVADIWAEGSDEGLTLKSDLKLTGQNEAIPSTQNISPSSKAAEIIAQTANQNVATNTTPSFIATHISDGGLEWFDPMTQEWTSSPALPSALNGTNITSVLTTSPHAQSAHPATQMLMVSIQKNAGSQENRNFTLRLDPPNLGKVDVEMNFAKDKLAKVQVIVEKPETLLMLQRDAQALERALQEAGLDTGQDNLSFELASEDQGFSQDGSHDGNRNGNNASDQDDLDIIETTMTWFVDPETGAQRYSLLA